MKTIVQAVKLFLILTLVTGVIYPLLITLLGQVIFPHQANGSQIKRNGTVIGSSLIGQKFTESRYFWPRPSAVDYNPLPSGGSNFGMTNRVFLESVTARKVSLETSNPGEGVVPSDLLFASASGLDPDISPQSARFQINRVAAARGLDIGQKIKLITLVENHIQQPDWRILGEPRINVLRLNLALDSAFVGNNQ